MINVVVGPGSVVGKRLIEHPDVAKIGFTGSTEVGREVMRGAAGADQARDARAWRQVGQRDLRRRRPRAGRRRCAVRRLRQRGPGLLRPLAHPRPARAYDRFVELLIEATRRSWSGTRRRGHRDGAADLGPAPRDRRVVRERRAAFPRRRAGRARLLVPVHARRGDERRPRRPRGGLRAGRRGDPVRRRGGGDPDRERHAVRAVGLDLDERRRAGAPRRARARDGSASRSTRTARCACRRRSAGSSSRASAASWGCRRSAATRRSRPCSSRRRAEMGGSTARWR